MKQERGERYISDEELSELEKKWQKEADERVEKTIRYYEGKRKASLTKRNKSKFKQSIRKKTSELNKLLNRSAKDKTVKQGLRESTADLLKVFL